jgi:PAS domain S-box-containing protein
MMEETIRIIMLEDNVYDAELIQHLLLKEKLKCEFNLATNRRSYLQALNHFFPAVILADHSLPEIDSEEAFIIARKKIPDIPFIMVTGTVSEEYAANMIRVGVDDYILKDRLARLPAAIVTAIQRRKAEKDKKEAQKKTIQSEANLRAIFENTSEGFLLINNEGLILAFNRKARKYVLLSNVKEFRIGQSIYDFIEAPRKEFFETMIKKVKNGENVHYDRSYKLENGRTAWIDFCLTPVIEDGEIRGVCIAGRDITEKKIIEQEREFDRNNLKALINNTNDLMWSVDRELKLITSNEAFDKMIMAMSGTTIARGDYVLSSGFSQEQLGRFHKYYKRAFSGESFMRIEYTALPEEFWSEISFYPIYNGDVVVGVACFSHDITGRKKAEKEITDYKNALDQSAIVSITDKNGIIKYANENLCKISGYSSTELIGQDQRILNSRYHPKTYFEDLWTIISTGKIWRGEFCGHTKDGNLYWLDGTIVPFLDSKGNPVQYLAIGNDITEKKMMEQEIIAQKIQEQKKIVRAIIQAQEKERNYLGQELHDNINQILASTRLYLEMAGQKNKELKALIKYPIELINNSIAEIRLLSSSLVTPLKNIDLEELVRQLLSRTRQNSNIQTDLAYSVTHKSLPDDLKLNIYRILQEQVNNVTKHAAARKINVSIRTEDNVVTVVVEDDGKGFDTNKKRKGIGISNVINRIESFNGEVAIESSPGKGCTLTIKAPY